MGIPNDRNHHEGAYDPFADEAEVAAVPDDEAGRARFRALFESRYAAWRHAWAEKIVDKVLAGDKPSGNTLAESAGCPASSGDGITLQPGSDDGLGTAPTRTTGKQAGMLRSLRANFKFWRVHVTKYIEGEIARTLGELAEKYRAQWSWLYVPSSEPGKLEALMASGYSGDNGRLLDIEGRSITGLVARSRMAYFTGDAPNDPHYRDFTGGLTESEQAVPILFCGRLLGVLNQESRNVAAFNGASARSLQEDCIRLVRHLLALEAIKGLRFGRSAPVLWNPDRHGWDLVGHGHEEAGLLDIVASQLRDGMGETREATHVCLWRTDPDGSITALTTTGYGSAFTTASLNGNHEPIDSCFAGELATRPAGTVEDRIAGESGLMRSDVDFDMGLVRVRAAVVRPCRLASSAEDDGQSGMVLSVYAFDEAAEAAMPSHAELAEVAELLREQLDAFIELRPELAEAAIHEAMYASPDSADMLSDAAELMSKVLSSSVVLFARPRHSSKLHLASATCPLDALARHAPIQAPPPRELGLAESGYEVGDGSFTGWFAAHPGQAIRINSPRSKSLLPGDCPKRYSGKLRERLPKTVGSFRRFLGYGLPGRSERRSMAVVRCVRTSGERPFTPCDLDVLRRMTNACGAAVRSWRDWHDDSATLGNAPAERQRLLQRLPRGTHRPIAGLVREVLVDVHDLVTSHFRGSHQEEDDAYVLQAAVLIEQPGNGRRPMSILAYHSELGSSPPPPKLTRYSLEETRLPGVGWSELLDGNTPMSFLSDQSVDGQDICAGARIPFISWCGRHPVRGVLVVDLSHPEPFEPMLMADLGLAARKVATALAAAGVDGPLSEINPDSAPPDFLKAASLVFGPIGLRGISLELDAEGAARPTWSMGIMPTSVEDRWHDPLVIPRGDGPTVVDRDTRSWDIQEHIGDRELMLRLPLTLKGQRTGKLIATWWLDETTPDLLSWRAGRIRDMVALWMLWSWSWRDRKSFPDPVSGGAYELDRCRTAPARAEEPGKAIAWPFRVRMNRRNPVQQIPLAF